MFRAAREWWSGGRAKVTLRLFAFEFLVVVLGVLTAQAVAEWSSDRAALRDMRQSKTLADEQIARMALNAEAWQRAAPCMDERMLTVMRIASGMGDIDPAILARPIIRTESFQPLSEDDLVLIRARHGLDAADAYFRMTVYAERASGLARSIAADWQALSIIDSATGRIGAGDRQEARIIASRVRSNLRAIRQVQANVLAAARGLRIPPEDSRGLQIPQSCEDVWKWKAMVYDPATAPTVDRPALR